MRRTGPVAALLIASLLGAVPAAAAVPISFHAPAQIQADALEAQATLVVLILPPGDAWNAAVTNATVTSGTRHQQGEVDVEGPYNTDVYYQDRLRDIPAETGWNELRLRPLEGTWASIGIEAESIHVLSHDAEAAVETTKGALAARWAYTDTSHELRLNSVTHEDATPLLVNEFRPAPVLLSASGLHRIEWHGASTSCPSGQECPEPSSEGPVVEFVEHRFSGGELTLTAAPHVLALAGAMDLNINGTARLPRTTGTIDCTDCDLTEDALTMRGNIHLTLHAATDDAPPRLDADLDGSFLARVNEAPPQPVGAGPATLVAVAAGIGLLVFLRFAVGLISQRILDAPLRNATRRSLYQAIEANPGATHRELMRTTGLGNGSLLHHLRVLEQAGSIHHWRNGRNTHYALATTRTGEAMQQRVLDDEGLGRLHRHLDCASGRVQLDVVRWAQETLGWARSTTQAKLRRLCEVGLVEVRVEGFRRVYQTVENARR